MEEEMKLAIGSDHVGLELKPIIIDYLKELGHEVEDFGPYTAERTDYPVYGKKVAEEVVSGNFDLGILICGTGVGISIAANKVKGIRCALCTDVTMARLTREHNDANMLSMGQRTTGIETCKDIVHTFLNTPFSEGERHKGRIAKISAIEDAQ